MSTSTHRNITLSLAEFVNHLQENVSLINSDPFKVLKIFNKSVKNASMLPSEVKNNSCSVAAIDIASKELLVKLPFEDAVEQFIVPSIALLDKIVASSLQCLEETNMEEKDFDTNIEVLMTCEQSVLCFQTLVPYIAANCRQTREVTSLPSSLPSTLLGLLHSVLLHCKHRGSWYEEHSSSDTRAVMSKLFRNTVDTTSVLFGALAEITQAAAATAPYTTGKILTQASSLCRLLSLLSEMKAVVCGWKSLCLLVQDIVAHRETERVIQEGGLQLLQILLELDQEVQEGLDLLYTLQEQKALGENPSSGDVVIRRVVKLCSFCVKLALTILEAFLEHAEDEVLRAALHLTARLSRCCVCVSLLQCIDTDCQTTSDSVVLGGGIAEQLLLGVQLLLAVFAKRPSFSQILPECVCVWISEVEELEKRHLQYMTTSSLPDPHRPSHQPTPESNGADPLSDSQILTSTSPGIECWGAVSGGPYLLLCCTALLLPDTLHRTPASEQLPIALLASLLSYLPCSSGLLNSQMAINSLGREGQAPSAIPLYEAAVVAASVAVASVRASVWRKAEPWLWGGLLALPLLPSQVLMANTDNNNDQAIVNTVGAESDDEDFFFQSSQRSKRNGQAKKTSDEENGDTGCRTLANKAAEGCRDWLWPHLLAADTLAFTARLGNGELCKALYDGLCTTLPSLPVHDDALVPHLSLVIIRLQRFLSSPPDELPCKAECKEDSLRVAEVNSFVSGVCLFGSGSIAPSAVYRELCTEHAHWVCSAVVTTIKRLLFSDDNTASITDLEHHLRCLHLLLLPRLHGLSSTVCAVATTDSMLQEVADALFTLWERFPTEDVGCAASAWLLSGLAAATAPVLDLLQHSQLATVVSVCGLGVKDGGVAVQEAVAAVVVGLARCPLSQPTLEDQRTSEAVAAACAALVSEERNWWVLQCSLDAFVHLAQHTPHKKMVAAVLKQCSSTAKIRLQKFLLQKPHPTPLSRLSTASGDSKHGNGFDCQSANNTDHSDVRLGDVNEEGSPARSSSSDETSPAAAPLFLFHQQCVVNTSAASRRRLREDARNNVKMSEEKRDNVGSDANNTAQDESIELVSDRLLFPSKRHRREEENDLVSKIAFSLSQSEQRWSLLTSELLSDSVKLSNVLRSAEALAASLEDLQSSGSQKRSKLSRD